MSLFILIILSGKIAGTIGPLPYDRPECERRVAEKLAEIDADETKREIGRKNNIVMRCEYHSERPKLGGSAHGR